MTIKLRYEEPEGDHFRVSVFFGEDADHLQLSGRMVLRKKESIITDSIAKTRELLRQALSAIDDADWPKVEELTTSAVIGASLTRVGIVVLESLKKKKKMENEE